MAYTIEQYDKWKTRILKYVLYKKRTEHEIRQKFEIEKRKNNSDLSQEMMEDIIQELKENGYISDLDYIDRSVKEFMSLKNMSVKEILYKLYSKGVSKNVMEEYVQEHIDELEDFEIKSAERIALKKASTCERDDIYQYMFRKGYKSENILKALDKLENI